MIIKKNNYFIIAVSFVILAIEIPVTRIILKGLITWACCIAEVKNIELYSINRYCLERIMLGALVLLVAGRIGIYVYCRVKDNRSIPKEEDTFEFRMFKYLNSKTCNKCFFINGPWGSGKTRMIDDFITKYYKHSNRSIYRLSCVGLSTRSDVVDEICRVMKEEDITVSAIALKKIKGIPVIGEPISALLEKEYGYHTAQRNTAFIFDDFERIVTMIDTDIKSFPGYYQDQFGYDSRERSDTTKALRINNKLLLELHGLFGRQTQKGDADKYLAIVSIINEMVERFGFKVIIICNSDKMDKAFLNDVVKSKLNCIIYEKKTSIKAASEYALEIADNHIIEDREKRVRIKEFIQRIDCSFVLKYMKTSNLRLFGNIIEAYILTANLLEMSDLIIEGFEDSLFSSILLCEYCKNSGTFSRIEEKEIGINIHFCGQNSTLFPINLRWVGYSLAGYWVMNLPRPYEDEIKESIKTWVKYRYIDIEKNLVEGNYDAFEKYDYNVRHVAIMLNKLNKKIEKPSMDWIGYFDKVIGKIDLHDTLQLNELLIDLGCQLDFYNSDYHDILFRRIAEGSSWSKATANSNIIRLYNEFIDKQSKGL